MVCPIRENHNIEVNNNENSDVACSLTTQATWYMQQYPAKIDWDVHQGVPTSILSYANYEKVVWNVFTINMTCWSDFLLSWNGCTATYLCNDCMKMLNFEDICWDATWSSFWQSASRPLFNFIHPTAYTHEDDEDWRSQYNNQHRESPQWTKQRLKNK